MMIRYQILAFSLFDKYLLSLIAVVFFISLILAIILGIRKHQYKKTTSIIQEDLGIDHWLYLNPDAIVPLKSARGVDNYNVDKYIKEDKDRIPLIYDRIRKKIEYRNAVLRLLDENKYKDLPMYRNVESDIRNDYLLSVNTFNILVSYVSSAGRSSNTKLLRITQSDIEYYMNNPTVLMSKSELNRHERTVRKNELDHKHSEYYDRVNSIIDYANEYRNKLIIQGDQVELDSIVTSLFDRTVNSIKRIKDISSEEWYMIHNLVSKAEDDVRRIINRNQMILDYYESPEFDKIRKTCCSLMDSQKEFNDYIKEKAQSISNLFGKSVYRTKTENDDEFNYIRPYEKILSPFSAEVSAQVFASAENNPMDYIIKHFYPDKSNYPTHIQNLQLLIEELATLKDAKLIIDNYKKEYQQYISNVPDYVLQNDENGFYSRLGFADVSESALTVAYQFSYTSGGGMAQRSFSVPMKEDSIVDLINRLENKLTFTSFSKEQRSLMTGKLRQRIKERDNFTCKICGNSTWEEPNLLLEIDHILPISKGGYTVENNLQTLCWKCNRSKSDRIM